MNSLISVIIPVFNVEKYVDFCIDSVCNQTYNNIEIILIDDGSTDASGEKCDKHAEYDDRIKVIHQDNKGLSAARNIGVNLSSGKYIVFVDSDDYISKFYVEKMFNLLVAFDADIVQCDYLNVPMDAKFTSELIDDKINIQSTDLCLYSICCAKDRVKYTVSWNKLYKKHLFDNVYFPEGKIHEDEFVSYLIFSKIKKAVITNQKLYYYRIRENSIMNSESVKGKIDGLYAMHERRLFLDNNMYYNESISICYRILNYIDTIYDKYKKDNYAIFSKQINDLFLTTLNYLTDSNHFLFCDGEKKIFCNAKKNNRVLLYGFGKIGKRLAEWNVNHKYYEIVGALDNEWMHKKNEIVYTVSPCKLNEFDFESIILCTENEDLIYEFLSLLYANGVKRSKISFLTIMNVSSKYIKVDDAKKNCQIGD